MFTRCNSPFSGSEKSQSPVCCQTPSAEMNVNSSYWWLLRVFRKMCSASARKTGHIFPNCIFFFTNVSFLIGSLSYKGFRFLASASRSQTIAVVLEHWNTSISLKTNKWINALNIYDQSWHFYKFSVKVDEDAGAKARILPVPLFVCRHGFTLTLNLCLFQVPPWMFVPIFLMSFFLMFSGSRLSTGVFVSACGWNASGVAALSFSHVITMFISCWVSFDVSSLRCLFSSWFSVLSYLDGATWVGFSNLTILYQIICSFFFINNINNFLSS